MSLKICVFGVGAIGGVLAARLGRTDAETCCVARGETRDAILQRGLRLVSDDGEITVPIACSDDPHELGPQDFVLLTLKAQSIPQIASSLQPLLHDTTTIVTLHNGLPWWFFQSQPGPYQDLCLQSVDPAGGLAATIDPQRVIGGVVYPAASVIAPGLVRHVKGDRLALGEPNGALTSRLQALVKIMSEAGLAAVAVEDIRTEICTKWVSNAALNPISVLSGATLVDMIDSPGVHRILSDMIDEVALICDKLGCPIPLSASMLLAGAHKMGRHKSSMLQDFEQGRPLETGPLLDTVQELSALLDCPTPTFDMVFHLLRLKLAHR